MLLKIQQPGSAGLLYFNYRHKRDAGICWVSHYLFTLF